MEGGTCAGGAENLSSEGSGVECTKTGRVLAEGCVR